jgi:hypothetical protein
MSRALRRRYGHVRGRVGGPDPRGMSAGEINKELDKLSKMSGELTDEMITGGRGYEKAWDTLKKNPSDDQQTLMYHAIYERKTDLQHEIKHRMGPGASSRLPKGFGPIRGYR